MNLKRSNYIVATAVINPDDPEAQHKRILFSTITNSSVIVKETIYTAISTGELQLLETPLVENLQKAGILVEASKDEFAALMAENDAGENILSLVLNTTAACSPGCTSCRQQHSEDQLTVPAAQAIASFIDNKLAGGNYSLIELMWDGGELLQNLPALLRLSEQVTKAAKKNTVPVYAGIKTNGYNLDYATFHTLFSQCGIRSFQITLDGDEENHDRASGRQEGAGSFSNIIANLKQIIYHYPFTPEDGIVFFIKINVTKENCEHIPGLLELMAGLHFQKRVAFRFAPVMNYGAQGWQETEVLSMAEFAEIEVEYEYQAAELGFTVKQLPLRKHNSCFATGKASYAIDVKGYIYSCYVFPGMEHPLKDANTVGSVFVPSTEHKATAFGNWRNELKEKKGECSECNLLPVCGGGCRFHWAEKNNGCPSFRYNIEDRLILQYLLRRSAVS